MKKIILFIIILALLGLAIAVTPWLFIWSVNTLFGTAIVFGWKTWLAAMTLLLLVQGSSVAR